MPADSEFLDDIELGARAKWDVGTELLAIIAELLDLNTRKGTKRKKPLIKIKRPWERQQKTKPVSMSSPEARQFFGARARGPAEPQPQIIELGGGWYELPNGEKVRGRANAEAQLKAGPAGEAS